MSLNKKFGDDFIWSLKYRPSNIMDVVLPQETKKTFEEFLATKEIPNMLFYGKAGIGKTTVASVLADTLGRDCLYINGSIETSIDVVRGKVTQFVSTMSFDGEKKIVIYDECLEENESIMMGTLDCVEHTKLKDLEDNKRYPVLSYNVDTNQIENDFCEVISRKEDEVFELELEDGRKIKATKNHPFFIVRDGKTTEILLEDLKEGDEILTI